MTLRSWSLRFGFVLLILLTAVLSRPFDPDLGLPLFYQFLVYQFGHVRKTECL